MVRFLNLRQVYKSVLLTTHKASPRHIIHDESFVRNRHHQAISYTIERSSPFFFLFDSIILKYFLVVACSDKRNKRTKFCPHANLETRRIYIRDAHRQIKL